MNITNSTEWSTADIRKLFRRCIQEVNKVEKPNYQHARHKAFQLVIMNSTSLRGRATLSGYWIMLKIPRSWKENNASNEMTFERKIKLARLIVHEYYHTLGYSYHDKHEYEHDFTAKWDVNWCKEYRINLKEQTQKIKKDIKAIRYERAITNLQRAETKLKRAKNLRDKWKAKIKYYEKYFCKTN